MLDHPPNQLHNQAPVAYQIKLQGQLDESWSAWFDGMRLTVEKD